MSVRSKTTTTVLLFLLLLIIRIPFLFTHHMQEDAYISLRCAENLAETGVYGFNPGEKVSSSTAHLLVFIAAFVRLVVGHSAFILVMQVLNILFFLAGTYLLARVLIRREEKERLLLWACISILPLSLLISYSGMETSLLVFLIGAGLYLYDRAKGRPLALVVLALMLWVRPDAIAYALLIVFWYSVRDRRLDWRGVIAVSGGVVSLLVFNQVYFGSLLHQSIIAKQLMQHEFSLSGLLQNMQVVFIGHADGGVFSPIRTKYLKDFGVLFSGTILAAIFINLRQNRPQRSAWIAGLTVGSMVMLVPLAYAFGGVLYQWYFWPSALLGYAILLAVLFRVFDEKVKVSKLARAILFILLIAGMAAQWAFSYTWGVKEYAYRGGIAVWLQQNARPKDRILLEPAGYIPYYSGLYTYDEVGLVSPQVVHYRQVYGLRWWPEFVMDFQPQWIIQRGHIADFTTYQGYELNQTEKAWFEENYRVAARFAFDPQDYATLSFLQQLLTLGEVDEYYVFKRVK